MSTLLAKTSLLSPAELRFFGVLKKAAGRKYHIAVKVRLADIIDCSGAAWEDYGRKISGMHVDFVLLHPKTAQIIMCIELDDSTHNEAQARERDRTKNNVLQLAAMPLLRVAAKMDYDKRQIRREIKACLVKGTQ